MVAPEHERTCLFLQLKQNNRKGKPRIVLHYHALQCIALHGPALPCITMDSWIALPFIAMKSRTLP